MHFVLVHSPLVGPLTWSLVAQELENEGHSVIIPILHDDDHAPFWEQQVWSIVREITRTDVSGKQILAGHSGAGPLLPLIGEQLQTPVAAYLFVDAGLPQPVSRLEMIKIEIPETAGDFEIFLKAGGRYPQWSDADLQPLIPDDTLRQQMLAELRPRALPFFTESIPVPAAWDAVPCGFIQLSAGYAIPAQQARGKDWPVQEFQARHFHMLVDAPVVANALVQIADQLLRDNQ